MLLELALQLLVPPAAARVLLRGGRVLLLPLVRELLEALAPLRPLALRRVQRGLQLLGLAQPLCTQCIGLRLLRLELLELRAAPGRLGLRAPQVPLEVGDRDLRDARREGPVRLALARLERGVLREGRGGGKGARAA